MGVYELGNDFVGQGEVWAEDFFPPVFVQAITECLVVVSFFFIANSMALSIATA